MRIKPGGWVGALRIPVVRRWLHWLLTAIVVAAVGAILIPVLRQYPDGLHDYFVKMPAWQRKLALFGASSFSAWLLVKMLSPRLAHLRPAVFLKHPPIWAAWVIACVILCGFDLTLGLGPSNFRATIWEWAAYGGGSVCCIALCRYLARAPEPSAELAASFEPKSVEEMVKDWATLETWLRSEVPAKNDLIGNRRIARRLATDLTEQGGTVGLLGPFGSGKSSVVAWLQEEVARVHKPGQPELLFVEHSCWGFEDSGSAVQQILTQAMEVVGRKADCFSLRFLPEAYRRTFSAGGDWLQTLADLVLGSTAPLDQFRQLSEILESVNARLVLVIEDLDRNTSSRFDRQEIQALLQQLRTSSKQISFVLATGQASAHDIDFAKLCDRIELLHEFDATQVSTLIEAVRHHCLNQFQDIAITVNGSPWKKTQNTILYRLNVVSLSEAATRLIRTPRALKHVLRNTFRAWLILHGEVNFDDLLSVNILRSGAPEGFNFLVQHRDNLYHDINNRQNEQTRSSPIHDQLIEEWKRITKNIEWDMHACMAILADLLPTLAAYLGHLSEHDVSWRHWQQGMDGRKFQGIEHSRYWYRIINEEIAHDEIRDQNVLRDTEHWRKSPGPELPLIINLCSSTNYVRAWERFAYRLLSNDQKLILDLAEHVLAQHLISYQTRSQKTEGLDCRTPTENTCEAFDSIRRYARDKATPGDTTYDWLTKQIRMAMPINLAVVNDLYYDWATGSSSIILPEDRAKIRQFIYDLTKSTVQQGEDLLRVLPPNQEYTIYQLVFPADEGTLASPLRGVQSWDWFGPVLLGALRLAPTRLALEVGNLISRTNRNDDSREITYRSDPTRLEGFFGSDAGEVVNLLAKSSETFSGLDREFLEQIVRSTPIQQNLDPS